MIKAIIFDFDGVIVESVDIKTKAFAELFEEEGAEVVEAVVEYHLAHAGVSRFDKFRYIYGQIIKRHLDKETFDHLCRRFSELVEEAVIRAPYVTGAWDFLKDYSHIYDCFIASATPRVELQRIISKKGADRFFKKIYGAPMYKSDIVTEILGHNRLLPADCVYVGDAMSDYEAASANRVPFIGRVHNDKNLFWGVPCLTIIPDLVSLPTIVENRGAEQKEEAR